MGKNEIVNEVSLQEIKKCWPERAVLYARKPKEGRTTNGSFAVQVLCQPAMSDKEADYCMESVRQVLPIKEFYSEATGSNIWIYWHYDKTKPVTFLM